MPNGVVYVAGGTRSPAFPAPSDNPSPNLIGFLARLNPAGDGYDAVRLLDEVTVSAVSGDAQGNIYICGTGAAAGTVTSFGPGGESDVVLVKLDPALSTVIWQVVVGGTGADFANALSVDPSGNVYVAGVTDSADWPVTPGVFQSIHRGANQTAFVAAVSASGKALLWSSYLGGSSFDQARAIAAAPKGAVYLAGTTGSADFPVVPGALQPTLHTNPSLLSTNGFVSEVSFDGATLLASTYLGGTGGSDSVLSLAAADDGSVTAAGVTDSPDLPVTIAGGAPSGAQAESTGFVARLKSGLGSIVFSEFVGGEGARANSIFVDANSQSYVAGITLGQIKTSRAVQPEVYASPCPTFSPSGGAGRQVLCSEGFVSLLDSSGNVSLSTYLNGYAGFEGAVANAIVSDGKGNVYIGGSGALTFVGAQAAQTSGAACLVKLNTNLTPPVLLSAGVTNAASVVPGLPPPGSLAILFCSGLTGIQGILASTYPFPLTLQGVTVTVGGFPAPILALADFGDYQQVNIQVPWDVASNSNAADIVVQQGDTSVWITQADFVSGAPGVFAVNGVDGAIQHSDYSLVSGASPAQAGEVIVVYATGLGPVSQTIGTGEIAPSFPLAITLEPVTAFIAGQSAEVLYAGLAPGEVGVYQLNIKVPTGIAAGSQELMISRPPVTDQKPPDFNAISYPRVSAPVKSAIR